MTTELVYSLKLLKFTGGGGVPFHESLARKINRRQTRIRFGLDRSSGSSAAVSDRNTVFPASIRLQRELVRARFPEISTFRCSRSRIPMELEICMKGLVEELNY
ncbi:unnamed protein product [Ilex paraguariensis]|uniref:Uncharacterized protein n=1 Tax=Ilex paraguariensis TaxID=185542 RepID=A0ABC8S2Q8_9AQUA